MIKRFEIYLKESHLDIDPYGEEDWEEFSIDEYRNVVEKELRLYPTEINTMGNTQIFRFDYIDENSWKLKKFWIVSTKGEVQLRSVGRICTKIKLNGPTKEIIVDAIEKMMKNNDYRFLGESTNDDIDPYGEEYWDDEELPIYYYKKSAINFAGEVHDETFSDDGILGYFNFVLFDVLFHIGTFGGGDIVMWIDTRYKKKKNIWENERLDYFHLGNNKGERQKFYDDFFLRVARHLMSIRETVHYDIDPLGEEEWNDDIDISNNKLFQAMMNTANWETNLNLITPKDHKTLTFSQCVEKAAKKVYDEIYGDDKSNKTFIMKALIMAGKWKLYVPLSVAKNMSFFGSKNHLIFRMMNKIKKIKLNET